MFKFIKIEDPSRFLDQFKPLELHPHDPLYIPFWRDIKRKCIEGLWFEDFNSKWRYGRGNLGFYGHYCTLIDTDKKTKSRKTFRPDIRDLEWHRSYYILEAKGFSGFTNDDKYTSYENIKSINKNELDDFQKKAFLKPNGQFKEYVNPREYLFTTHDKPLGLPQYLNQTRSHLEFGARGSGKSYYYALAEMKYNLCFSGLKSFDIDNIDYILNNLPVVHQNLGAAIKSKAFETAKKIDESLRELKTNTDLGAFYLGPEDGWIPNPFWIRMNGSYDPDKSSSWHNLHRVKRGNEWIIEGEGHSIETKIYSPNKRTGAQAGAGGRKDFILYEEIGLFEELLTAWMSDEAVISVEGDRFGVKVGIGTSGNIDTIEPARKIFMHPTEYKCLEFTEFDDDTKTCFFLADWMVDRRFKDKHGMTDEEAAIEHHKNEHKLREDTGDPDIINGYRMNNPHKIEHMWLSHEGNLLPVREAEVREKQLLKGNLYEKLGTPVVLFADPRKPEGVSYEVDHESKPILSMTDDNMEGCIMMYEQPFRYNGQIPPDAHFIFHDPYFSEAMDKGGSIGATIVLINPKYIPQGAKGNCIAMTYFGKNPNGLDAYNRNLELICQFYGNPHRKLWYEANKGEFVRSYFIHPSRRKAYLLCLRPQFVQGAHVYKRNTPYTGFMVPNGVAKLNMITKLNDWLLEETTLIDQETQKEETLANIFRIPDLLLIRQIKAYTLKGNFDTVSALLAAPLALEEEEHVMKDKLIGQNRPHDNYTSKLLKRYGKARTNIRSQNI